MAKTYTDLTALLNAEPPSETFTPYCYHSEEADALTFKIGPEPDYSKRLTTHVTIFRAIGTDQITGCRIKGIKDLLEDLPNSIHIDDGKNKLKILLWAYRSSVDDPEGREGLKRLAKAAEGVELPCN